MVTFAFTLAGAVSNLVWGSIADRTGFRFGVRDDLPIRIAIANMASEIAGTIGPLLGGLLAACFGYLFVFMCSICFLAIGDAVVRFYVPEPRR